VTRRELLVAAVGLLMVAGASILAAPQVPGPVAVDKALEDAISAYSAGDDGAVERWLSMAHLSPRVHYTRFEAAMVRPAPWSRARAAFVLEVAVRNGIGESQLSSIGRAMVIGRSTALGVDAAEDRFEILFHHVTIGLLQERMAVKPLDDYVDAVGSKLDDARRRGVALETRIPLARAFTSALLCCWTRSSGVLIRTFRDLSRSRVTLADALAQFEEAAREPPLRPEALIRGAKLLFDNNRRADALAWLERVPNHSDQVLGYVHHWTHPRLLDNIHRPVDAAAAYRRALAFAPRSQAATIGLAAALQRAGRAEESARAAADARAMHVVILPPESATRDLGDLMPTFDRGDNRFVRQWLAEVRRLQR
jgi:tetratricopeptide (TPR) repeat protein